MKTVRYLLALGFLLWATAIHAAVVIDTVFSVESTCQANGILEPIASGAQQPFIYSITAGPVTRPAQSSPIFSALPAGTYTILVENQIGESATTTAVVTGSYQLMTIHPIPVIYCTGASQGYIIGNVVSGGKPPFTYQLVAPSPVTTVPQSSDTFYNLPDGSYTLRVTDDCGNFQTTGVVLSSVPSSFSLINYANFLGCNNSGVLFLGINYTNLQLPINVTLYDDLGNSTVMTINSFNGYINSNTYWNVIPDFNTINIYMPLQHSVLGGSTWQAVITNACGVSLTVNGFTATEITPFPVGVVQNACPPRLAYSYSSTNNQGMQTILGPDSLMFYLYDETIGAITDSFQSSSSNYIATNGIVGHSYHLIIKNSCNVIFNSLSWVWSVPAPPMVFPYPVGLECLDSTIAMEFTTMGFNTTAPLMYIIHSGPASLHSTKPGFAYNHSLSYPDTLMLPAGSLMRISNLPPGTYAFSIIDTCGQRIDSTFTITNDNLDIKRYNFESVITGQCGIFNAIDLFITRGDKYAYPFPIPHFTYTITNITTGQIIETDNVVDSVDKVIYNVPTGTYVLRIDFFEFNQALLGYLNDNHYCTTIYDTIVVNGSPFPHINGFINSFCQTISVTELVIDSAGGVPPYTYEIIAGPMTVPPQSSNVFILPFIGTYTFRMVDACGNSYVSSTAIDTLVFPPLQVSNTPCPGSNVVITALVSQFYSYHWQLPDGSTYNGDTLSITNVSAADTGIYTVTRYADIYGCKDTLQTTLHLEMLARVSQSVTVCYGDTLLVGTTPHYTAGTFIDTLSAAAGCDSIVTTHITILPAKYDTISATICQGQPLVIGPHIIYVADTAVHLLNDTITSSTGCDSIVTVHLTVNQQSLRFDTIYICQGDTAYVPIEVHSGSGTIIDTQAVFNNAYFLATLFPSVNGCDSATFVRVIMHPTYFVFRYDTICHGDTVLIGNHAHTQTGNSLDTLSTVNGCDSVILLLLTVKPADTFYITKTICAGQSVNGHTTAGVYTDALQTASGCDSILILNLSVGLYAQDSTASQLCAGQSITFGTHIYNQTGVYRDTFATVNCDSISILNLSVLPFLYDSTSVTICAGQSIAIGTHTYNQTGIYRDTLSTINCDSIVVLNLSVLPFLYDSTALSICAGQSITVGTHTYSQSGIYRDTLSTINCDSIVVINLTLLTQPHDTIVRSICSGQAVTVGAHTYNQSGEYTDTLPTNNCDSVVTLILSVGSYQTDSAVYFVCEGNSIFINGISYSASGIYYDTVAAQPCDSLYIINVQYNASPVIEATANPTTITVGGTVQLDVLTANNNLSFIWSGAGAISNTLIQNPTAVVNEAAWFIVTATDTLTACTALDSVFVDIEEDACTKRNLFVPNVFTPNADNNNDEFRIYSTCPFQKFNIKIFNRWGEKVFESADPYFTWNGTYKNEVQTPAVFVYYLEGMFANNDTITNKGSVTLIR
ncbi:MAG: gliding motility-associated C-terminal domain-containing protein [Chitinophagales bacterium]